MSDRRDVEGLAPLSDALMEIMNIVWNKGEATVSDVRNALPRKLAGNTVQTMMSRLVEKGWLENRKEGRSFIYFPTVKKSATMQSVVTRMVDNAFEGSADGLIMALLNGRGISAEERDRIQSMINDGQRKTGEE
jgi:BlaI family penicillinase repressor